MHISVAIRRPSRGGIEMTRAIVGIAKLLGIAVHDHIIDGKDGHASEDMPAVSAQAKPPILGAGQLSPTGSALPGGPANRYHSP